MSSNLIALLTGNATANWVVAKVTALTVYPARLGLDNIGVFDRSAPLPTGGSLEQADGAAGAGAHLGAAFGAYRRWSMAILAMLLGFVAGLAAKAARYLTVFLGPLRSFDMQLLLLLSAGLLLNLVAVLIGGTAYHERAAAADRQSVLAQWQTRARRKF